jgi:hypothetical protein
MLVCISEKKDLTVKNIKRKTGGEAGIRTLDRVLPL